MITINLLASERRRGAAITAGGNVPWLVAAVVLVGILAAWSAVLIHRTAQLQASIADVVRQETALRPVAQQVQQLQQTATYLQGRQAVLDFYHRVWADVDEEVVPGKIAIDNENGIMMVEITTRLRAKHDNAKLGAFRVFAHQGDLLVVPGVIAYGLADGLITTIAGIDTGESYRPASKAHAAPFPNDTAVVTPEVKAQVEKAYREYVTCFNQKDLDCITNYFGKDFVFKGPIWTLHGIPEFKAFYINAWRHFNEHLTIKSIEVRPNQIIVDVYNQLSVSNDFPDFAAGPLKKGDNHLVTGPIVYTLKNGRVSHIESETRLSPPPCVTGNCASKRAGSGSHDLILKEGNG